MGTQFDGKQAGIAVEFFDACVPSLAQAVEFPPDGFVGRFFVDSNPHFLEKLGARTVLGVNGEAFRAQPDLSQAMTDHFQGGRLLGEEKDLLSLVDGACDEVDDGLRLSRSGRSLDHQARSFGNVENGRVLGAVHGQGEGGHRFRVLLVVDVPQGEPLLDGVAAEYPGTHSGNAFIGETFRKQFRWGDAGRPEDADRHPPAEVPLGPSVLGRVVLEQVEVGVYVEVFRILFHGFGKPGRFFPRGLL